MPHDVFVSYASEDKPVADAAVARLESSGIRCWIAPRDILPGSDWSGSILDAIEGARVFVLIFTRSSNGSPHVATEIERAVSHGLTIIPVRIENVLPARTLEFFLTRPHWLDAFSPPLEQHLDYLAKVVKHILAGPPGSSPELRPAPTPKRKWTFASLALIVAIVAIAWGAYSWFQPRGQQPPHRNHPEPDPLPNPAPPPAPGPASTQANVIRDPPGPRAEPPGPMPQPEKVINRGYVPQPPPQTQPQPPPEPQPKPQPPSPVVSAPVTRVNAAGATFELQCVREDPQSNVVLVIITLKSGAPSVQLNLRDASFRNAGNSRELSLDGPRTIRTLQSGESARIRLEGDPSSDLRTLQITLPVIAGSQRDTIGLARQAISG